MAVVAVLPDAGMRARLAGALRGGPAVRFCATCDEARAALAAGGARALVVAPRDAAGVPTEALVAAACAAHPRLTAVAYCALARTDPAGWAGGAVGLVRAGVHTVLMRDVDDAPHAIQAALRGAEQGAAAREVLALLPDALPPAVRALVALYLRSDDAPPTVAEVAAALGVHRRTLVNRMRSAGSPPPRALRVWCRVFVAAYLLEDGARTVESVALQLDFDSPSGLRNTLRRYTGRAPHALRAAGGLRCALAAFAAACAARAEEGGAAAGAVAPAPRRLTVRPRPSRRPARPAARPAPAA